MSYIVLFLLVPVCADASSFLDRKASQQIETKNGSITGRVLQADYTLQQPRYQNVIEFLGIPYAAPPIGDLRFRAPRPFNESWSHPRSMVNRGLFCEKHEDCLYLDVYTPEKAPGFLSLPVLFWIHGGGFMGFHFPQGDGVALSAAHDLVVVIAHYCLGHLAFFASDASLSEEGSTGNWGTLDQRAALLWVKENIANFGGDPGRVTIAGESAGAFSVLWHLVAPGSAGLYHAAILESTTVISPIFYQAKKDAYRYYEWVATQLAGCKDAQDLQCLRKVDFNELQLNSSWQSNGKMKKKFGPPWASVMFPKYPVGPVIDGVTLRDSPLNVVKKGGHSKVPIILGVNHDEGTGFIYEVPQYIQGASHTPTETIEKKLMAYLLGEAAVKAGILEMYPDSEYHSWTNRAAIFSKASRILRDSAFHCSTLRLAEALIKWDDRVYMYTWNFEGLFGILDYLPIIPFTGVDLDRMGFFHSAELPFVLKYFPQRPELSMYIYAGHPPREKNDDFHRLSDCASCMWANMVTFHSPVGGNASCESHVKLVDWPKFDGERFLYISRNPRAMSRSNSTGAFPNDIFPSNRKCNVFDNHQAIFRDVRIAVDNLENWNPNIT